MFYRIDYWWKGTTIVYTILLIDGSIKQLNEYQKFAKPTKLSK